MAWDDMGLSFMDTAVAGQPQYIVYRHGGIDPRTIKAWVRYAGRSIVHGYGVMNSGVTITVANDATSGIDRTELDLGADRVEMAMTPGGTAEIHTLGELVNEDEGVLTIEVR